MMGLQATSGKRKLDGGVGCTDFDMDLGESPSKLGRVEGSWWALDDSFGSSSPSYYDMEVVASSCLQSATPNNPCQLSPVLPSGSPASAPASAAPSAATTATPAAALPAQPTPPAQPQAPQPSPPAAQPQGHLQTSTHYYQRPVSPGSGYQPQQPAAPAAQAQPQPPRPQAQWGHHASAPHHYEPPTIRREENGKSYLELGSSYRANERCCEGSRSSWCRRGRACYRQRRLAVLNISMCKLARYRQFPDPSLHRSVLICNTLRYLEREMERDRSPPPMEPVLPAPLAQLQPPEQGRLTPFPVSAAETDADSGIGDSEDSRSINWGSVLSLSSQSPLDPLNNNELLDVDIAPDLDLDFMPGWKLPPAAEEPLRPGGPSPAAEQQHHHHGHHHHHHHHHHHLHLHHHHLQQQQQQQQQQSCTNAGGAAGGSTHESLMCVGS